jgi:HD-like signal output (HDOD) protein
MEQVHLLVACHGMWGNPNHLAELARHAREKFAQEGTSEDGAELVVHVAQTNRGSATYDGIDWGGERIADEASPK